MSFRGWNVSRAARDFPPAGENSGKLFFAVLHFALIFTFPRKIEFLFFDFYRNAESEIETDQILIFDRTDA